MQRFRLASGVERQSDLLATVPKRPDLSLLAAGAVVFGAQKLVPAYEESYRDWYPVLKKPSWNPPKWVFPAVWIPLKVLQSGALWIAWRQGRDQGRTGSLALALTAFGVHLLLGNTWNVVFFGQRRLKDSLPVMASFWLSIAGTIASFWPLSRAAALLMAPTQVWVSIAAKLNWDIVRLNTAEGEGSGADASGWGK